MLGVVCTCAERVCISIHRISLACFSQIQSFTQSSRFLTLLLVISYYEILILKRIISVLSTLASVDMHFPFFLFVALTGSALAAPRPDWSNNATSSSPPISASSVSSHIPSGIQSGTGHTVFPTVSSSTLIWAPTGSPRPTEPQPTTNQTASSSSTSRHTLTHSEIGTNSTATATSIYTTTETVTRFTLVPQSTPVSVSGTKTFYSTYISSQAYTTTTSYPVTTPASPGSDSPNSPGGGSSDSPGSASPNSQGPVGNSPNLPGQPPINCPPAPIQVTTIYIDSLSPHQTVIPAPPPCDKNCQTITYTDTSNSVITITIPSPSPATPSPNQPPRPTDSSKDTPPYPTTSGTSDPPPRPTGASLPSGPSSTSNRPTGTGSGTGK